jgi:hypothetical protein
MRLAFWRNVSDKKEKKKYCVVSRLLSGRRFFYAKREVMPLGTGN